MTLRDRVRAEVKSAKWRSEVSLCRQFGGTDTHPPTEDVLFELVQSGEVQWFGSNDKPLRYRAVTPTPGGAL